MAFSMQLYEARICFPKIWRIAESKKEVDTGKSLFFSISWKAENRLTKSKANWPLLHLLPGRTKIKHLKWLWSITGLEISPAESWPMDVSVINLTFLTLTISLKLGYSLLMMLNKLEFKSPLLRTFPSLGVSQVYGKYTH